MSRSVRDWEMKNGSKVGVGGYASIAAAVRSYYTFHAETRCMVFPRNSAMPRTVTLQIWKPRLRHCNLRVAEHLSDCFKLEADGELIA